MHFMLLLVIYFSISDKVGKITFYENNPRILYNNNENNNIVVIINL